nr:MAG TPA: hypothetical protein [Caudoviricetes sp.]
MFVLHKGRSVSWSHNSDFDNSSNFSCCAPYFCDE